jgi:hypothetical protein
VHQEHAAWIVATELVRATIRSAVAVSGPFTKGPRPGQAVAARDLSFTTARRTLTASVAAGTATAQAFGHAPREITTRTSSAFVHVCGSRPPAAALNTPPA